MNIWYVRPSGGTYGAEDGTSYATAWDGFSNITWGVGGVVAGDTLYVCGTHYEMLQNSSESGTAASPIIIRGDYGSDPGIIDGSATWANDDVWIATADDSINSNGGMDFSNIVVGATIKVIGGTLTSETSYTVATVASTKITTSENLTDQGSQGTPIADSFYLGIRTWCIDINTVDYVHVLNIATQNCGIPAGGGGVQFNACTGCYGSGITSTDTAWDGILIEDCADTRLDGCTVTRSLVRGISISSPLVTGSTDDVVVRNSTGTQCGRRAFTVSGNTDETYMTYAAFENCTATNNGGGITMEYCDKSGSYGCTISGTMYDSAFDASTNMASAADHMAVRFLRCKAELVNANITHTGTAGSVVCVYIAGMSAGLDTSAKVIGCHIITDGSYGIRHLSLNDDVEVSGNYLEQQGGATTYGITMATTVNAFVCNNNTIVGGLRGFAPQGTVSGEIKNNIFYDQSEYAIRIAASGHTVTFSNNCYHPADTALDDCLYNAVGYSGLTELGTMGDPAPNIEDPLLTGYIPANTNMIKGGVGGAISPYVVDATGYAYPSYGVDIGGYQSRDSTNHPFHPINL